MLSITTDTVDMYNRSDDGYIIKLPPVGPRTPAVDFMMWLTGNTRVECNATIQRMLNHMEVYGHIFNRKEFVSGEFDYDYTLTYDQCYEVLNFCNEHYFHDNVEIVRACFETRYACLKSDIKEPMNEQPMSKKMETANYVLRTLLSTEDYADKDDLSDGAREKYRDCFFKLVNDLKENDAPPITTFFKKADLKDEPRITRQSKKARLGL